MATRVTRIDDAVFDAVERDRTARCRERLLAWLTADLAPGDAAARAETARWLDATIAAAAALGLEDCGHVARYVDLMRLEPLWSANPLHAAYVETMLHEPHGGIEPADGVMAAHRNVVVQHYGDRPATPGAGD